MRAIIMAATLALAGCGAETDATAAQATGVQATGVQANPAAEPAANGAALMFVRGLYARLADTDFAPLSPDDAPLVFTTDTVAMIQDARNWPGEGMHPALEADPVCQCQDPTGLRLAAVDVVEGGQTEATLAVRLDYGGDAGRDLRLILRREAGEWRIHDITGDGAYSFRASLSLGMG